MGKFAKFCSERIQCLSTEAIDVLCANFMIHEIWPTGNR